jgi:hypothetical protein
MEVEIRTDLPARIKAGRKRAKDSDPQKLGLARMEALRRLLRRKKGWKFWEAGVPRSLSWKF